MDIKTFDTQLNYLGVVDNYDSVDFKTRFCTIGDFTITAPITKQNIKRLAKGNFILIDNQAGYIETIQLDEDFEESKITAVGYDLKGLIAHRINPTILHYKGTAENYFRKLVNDNCVSTEKDRIIPFLSLGEIKGYVETTERNDEGSNIAELISVVSNFYKIGWTVDFKPKEKKLIFNVFKGVDRTINQTSVTPLVFERKRENILEQVYVDSNEGHKNVAYVGGEKVDDVRTATAIVGSGTGFNRREIFVEATSGRADETGQPIPTDEYQKLIETEGKQALAEKYVINNFDCVVNTKTAVDFGIGDLCTVINNEWNVLMNVYISEIERIYDNNGVTVNVVFGNNIKSERR